MESLGRKTGLKVRGWSPGVKSVAVLLAMSAASPMRGQLLDHFNPLSGTANGVHLYGVTVSGMYSAGTGAGLGIGVPLLGTLPRDARLTTLQTSASVGWSRTIEKSSFQIGYTPSYVRSLRGPKFDSTNHAASMSWARPLGMKWSLASSLTGMLTDFSQLPFARSRLGTVAATPSTFDDLVSSMLTGNSGNMALNRAVNAATPIGSPETAFLYGGRLLSVSAGVSAGYAYSSRSSLNFGLTGVRMQTFALGNNNAANVAQTAFLARTTGGGATIGWNYSLTPRTTLGANLSTNRQVSQWQDSYNSQAGLSVGRTLTSRWFVQGNAGVGWITPLRQTFRPITGAQITYGGSTGYKLYAHTFIASFNRFVADVYGIGANGTETANGAWVWKIPGNSISISSGFGYSRLISPVFRNGRSVSGFASVGKALNSHLVASAGYSYMQFPGTILESGRRLTQSAVTASLSWSPSERR